MSPTTDFIAAGCASGDVMIWDMNKKKLVSTLKNAHKSDITSCTFSPDGKYLAAASTDKSFSVWE